MDLIYSMRRKPLKYEPPHFERVTETELIRPICTISCCNIIAFSSPTELSDADCDTWGGHVYVCDLDTPWDCHKVVSTTHPVSALEWDGEGKQLLVATTEGEVSVFGQKDFLLNDWTCLYSAKFRGERIVKAVFFHNGRRLVVMDKKHDIPLTEKIQALRSAPTLKGFGGVPIPGACVITSTGLVCAVTGDSTSIVADTLRAHRDRITHASFAHKNGNLLVAGVCVSGAGAGAGAGRACVRVCVCVVTRSSLSLTALPTLQTTTVPTCITWCLRSDTDSLLVAGGGGGAGGSAGGTLSLWKLTERQHQVHKLLAKGPIQGSTTPGGGQKPASDCFSTLVWQQTAVWGVEAGAWCTSVASSRLALGAPHAVLATPKKLHLLSRDTTHHYICSRAVSCSGPDPPASSPPKKPKYGNTHVPSASCSAIVSCVDISWLGGVSVAVDTRAQLHVYRLWPDLPSPLSVQLATSLLEYSMVSGVDALDVMLTFKHNMADAVYERVTESFQRQPAPFQQYYFHTWLKIRTALCRVTPGPGGASSVSWLSCACAAWAAWAACVTALRHDDKPDDKLLAALLDEHHPDHDKALVALESKAELPAELQVLVGLRRVVQRALDIAVTALLAATTPSAAHHNQHGYELWTDPAAVMLLRRLVVLARGAGGAGGGAAGGDMALSRLLARIHQPAKPDYIEECNAVCALYPTRVWEVLPRAGVSAAHNKPTPLYLEYGVTPEGLVVSPDPPPTADNTHTHTHMDSIRYMYLGGLPVWRQCTRCGARSFPHPHPSRHPLQRAHDARFLAHCRCGGKWSLVSNTTESQTKLC